MGEGGENNCIWQKNLASRELSVVSLWQGTLCLPLAMWRRQSHSLSRVNLGQYKCRRGFQLLGGGGKATGPTQEATAVC